ncbi:MAG: hypothetical protein ACKO7O_08220 [Bacteroidota bacterium]
MKDEEELKSAKFTLPLVFCMPLKFTVKQPYGKLFPPPFPVVSMGFGTGGGCGEGFFFLQPNKTEKKIKDKRKMVRNLKG